MSKRVALLFGMIAAGLAGAIAACVDDRAPLGPKPDAGIDPPMDRESGVDAAPPMATILARFDAAAGELPEGLTIHPDGGAVLVGLSLAGRVVRVLDDGGAAAYATFSPFTNAFLLGLASDTAGNTYAAIASIGGGTVPTPGIYRIPPGGGTPVPFSVPTTPPMLFPNGIDVVGSDLYVTDSFTGRIFKVDSAGAATVWAERAELSGIPKDAGLVIGANGITHDDTGIFVTNFERGLFLRFDRGADASVPDANAPTIQFQNLFLLVGADGVVHEGANRFLVANNPQDRIVRLLVETREAGVEVQPFVAYEGPGFDKPASLAIRGQELLFTNAAFRGGGEDAGPQRPSLASVPLP
jgi:hypothetical protein